MLQIIVYLKHEERLWSREVLEEVGLFFLFLWCERAPQVGAVLEVGQDYHSCSVDRKLLRVR